jgi:hypothetical protein
MPEHNRKLKTYDCLIIMKQKIEKKEDSVEIGTVYKNQQARDYLMQQHRNSKNFSMITKMTASIHFCKDLHLQNPLIIPSGKRPKTKACWKNLICPCGHHKELGREATSKKHTLSLNS